MSIEPMLVRVVSPSVELEVPGVVHLRFDTHDGSRGVLPGHEHATALVREGALYLSTVGEAGPGEVFVVTEGGMAVISGRMVVIVTSWADRADDLATLADQVRARDDIRRQLEADARALSRRHEVAIARGLAALKREVSW